MTSNRSAFTVTRKGSTFSMASEEEGTELDQESIIGSVDSQSDNMDWDRNVDELGSKKSQIKSLPLLRGDKVLAVGNIGGWNLLRKRRKDSKMITGTVILGKEQTLSILWEHGKIEKLSAKSDLLSYGNRVFVLDRECITTGSRVVVTGHPDRLVGRVLNKRYIAAGNYAQNPDVIFDNVETKALDRHVFGGAYFGCKLLYRGWIGVAVGCRVRVYLKAIEDGNEFSIICEGRLPQNLYFGEEVKLGVGLLWKAEELGSLWLASLAKYYNTSAIVTSNEIEELDVCWIGKISTPRAEYIPYDSELEPEKIIPSEELQYVNFLFGENYQHIKRNSLWLYNSTADVPISRDRWIGKWLKIVDWDRWKYPNPEEVQNRERYMKKDVVLQIQCVRAVVDVLWDNGTRSTVGMSDVIPAYVGSVWSEVTKLQPGTIVCDRLDFESKDKYGILLTVDQEMNANVKWISPTGKENVESSFTATTSSRVPLYNLVEKEEYEFISRVNQFPLVHAPGHFQIGVVTGLNCETGEVEVKLPDSNNLEYRMPHELEHYKCDVLYCPKEDRWVSWYEHVIPPSGIVTVGPFVEPDAEEDICKESLSVPIMRKRIDFTEDVPSENIFVGEDMIPRVRETQFRRAVEKEVAEMNAEGQDGLPDGIWVEYYINRGDIMSAVVAGPDKTVYEDFLFVYDIFLLEDFPRSEPHINFRSMGVTLFPRHFCKSGAVFLPEETRLTEKDFTLSYVQNLLLEVKDFMLMPLDQLHQIDNVELGMIQHETVEELHKFLLLSLLDYTIAILKKPPKHWSLLISQHFSKALPRIVERYTKGPIQLEKIKASVSNEKGDIPKMEEIELETVPWGDTYRKSIQQRVDALQGIHASWKNSGKL